MRQPKTIKGYLSFVQKVADLPVYCLNGYDDLSREQKTNLASISGELANAISEYNYEYVINRKDLK